MQNLKLNKNNKTLQISCDGGAATGKSTGAKMISKKYKLKFLSSGLLYRYAGYLILRNKLHTQSISSMSAKIAKIKGVRKILKNYQLDFVKKYKNCCIEGRDISTNILPNSDVKFYFVCNLNKASIRRYRELKKLNSKINLNDVKKALRSRNISDIKRKNSPLLKHRDSVVIDTGKLNKQEMLAKMSKHIEKILK